MKPWLELAGVLLALAILWTVVEPYFLGRTAPPSRRAAPPGTGPREYVDAARDNPPGEEGPSQYQRATGWPAETTQRILDQMAADSAKERTAARAAWNAGVRPTQPLTEEKLREYIRQIKRRAYVPHRRDGVRLSEEASAEVLRAVFGDTGPSV